MGASQAGPSPVFGCLRGVYLHAEWQKGSLQAPRVGSEPTEENIS